MTGPYAQIAQLYAAMGNAPQQKIDEMAEQLREAYDHPAALAARAFVSVQKGTLYPAIAYARKGAALAAVMEGNSLRNLGRIGDAIAMYDHALEIDNYNFEASEALASFYRQPSQFDPEIAALRRPQPEIYKTPIGTYFLPADARRDWIVCRMKAGKFFQSEIIALAAPFIAKGSAVIDLGANLGQMTLAFSDLVGPEGTVHCVEANAYIYRLLTKNIQANGRKNVIATYGAAYDKAGETLMFPEPDLSTQPTYGSHGLDPQARAGTEVKTLTVDGFAIERPVTFIKVDIQGADLVALRGAKETIARHKPAIIFEVEDEFLARFGTTRKDYSDFVEEIGYKVQSENGHDYLIVPK